MSPLASRAVVLVRRPLFQIFVLGVVVSALASARFSTRLILDGAISFAFIPLAEVTAFVVVRARGARVRARLAADVDAYFVGDMPWLAWLTGLAAVACAVPPATIGNYILLGLASAIVPFVWTYVGDVRFFRHAMGRSTSGAVADVAITRAIAWTAGLAYFLGIAIWSEQLPELVQWLRR